MKKFAFLFSLKPAPHIMISHPHTKAKLQRELKFRQFFGNHGNLTQTFEKDILLSILKWPLSLYPNTCRSHHSHENLRPTYARLKRLLYHFIVLLTQHTVKFKESEPNLRESGWNRAKDINKRQKEERKEGESERKVNARHYLVVSHATKSTNRWMFGGWDTRCAASLLACD